MLGLKHAVRSLRAQLYTPVDITFECDSEFNARVKINGQWREYKPEPTLLELHKTLKDYSVVNAMGPYGSGKSTAINWQALFCATQMMPPCKDGVRRSKVAFIRGTYDELKQTTYDLWMSWFGGLSNVKSTLKPLEYTSTFYDKHGKIEIKIVFLALDKIMQYKKLRSSNFTFAYINEASESPEGIIFQVLARTGRYPSMDLLDVDKVTKWFERPILLDDHWQTTRVPYWSGVICDTNPPEVDSELYKIFEVQKPRGYKLFKQPAGLLKTKLGWAVNPDAENLKRLGMDYYSKQSAGATEEFVNVFCCGNYGSIKAGKLVYENYNDNIHAVENLEIVPNVPLRIAFDTWFQPACIISQYVTEQVRVLAALYEPDCSVQTFVNDITLPFIVKNFQGLPIYSVVFDPAGMAGHEIPGATSDYQIILNAFKPFSPSLIAPALSNAIKPRINAVEHLLKTITRAQPAIVMDKAHADLLRQGFLKHYTWRETKTTRELIREPKKNKYSHCQDAMQYEAMQIVGLIDYEKEKPGTYLAPIPQMATHGYGDYYAR